jgi:hypothetical protein
MIKLLEKCFRFLFLQREKNHEDQPSPSLPSVVMSSRSNDNSKISNNTKIPPYLVSSEGLLSINQSNFNVSALNLWQIPGSTKTLALDELPVLKKVQTGSSSHIAQGLESLSIKNCPELKEVEINHPNLSKLVISENCDSLKTLNLSGCKNLKMIAVYQSVSLEMVDISGCLAIDDDTVHKLQESLPRTKFSLPDRQFTAGYRPPPFVPSEVRPSAPTLSSVMMGENSHKMEVENSQTTASSLANNRSASRSLS